MTWNKLIFLVFLVYTIPVNASEDPQPLREDKQQVRAWNRFFDSLLKIHHWYGRHYRLREVSQDGGYATHPDFYRETSYYDKATNRLLSRVRWVKAKPTEVHTIEVFRYDDQGRVSRDYLAAYLPDFRNAPIQTLINFHYYHDGLHAFRQFDASGALIYEQCQGRYFNEDVMLSIEEDDFDDYRDENREGFETYLACFEMLPKQAGPYLHPYQVEIQQPADNTAGTAVNTDDDIDRQIKLMTARLAKDPADLEACLARGDAYFKLHAFDKAVADFSRALAIDKDSGPAWFGRGMAYGRMGQIDKGIADLSEFIRRNPASSLAYTKRGVRYLWKGDRDNAERDLRKAVQLNPDNAEAHDDLGVIHAQRGELARAIEHFSKTVRVDPSYQKGYHNLALAYYLAGQQARAQSMIDKALAIKPDEKVSLLLKSRILAARNKPQQAEAVQERAEFLPEANWSELAPAR